MFGTALALLRAPWLYLEPSLEGTGPASTPAMPFPSGVFSRRAQKPACRAGGRSAAGEDGKFSWRRAREIRKTRPAVERGRQRGTMQPPRVNSRVVLPLTVPPVPQTTPVAFALAARALIKHPANESRSGHYDLSTKIYHPLKPPTHPPTPPPHPAPRQRNELCEKRIKKIKEWNIYFLTKRGKKNHKIETEE